MNAKIQKEFTLIIGTNDERIKMDNLDAKANQTYNINVKLRNIFTDVNVYGAITHDQFERIFNMKIKVDNTIVGWYIG